MFRKANESLPHLSGMTRRGMMRGMLATATLPMVAANISPENIVAAEPAADVLPGGTGSENGQAVRRSELIDHGGALINPSMGWTMHFYSNITSNYGSRLAPSDALEWFEGCSTVYLRLPWAYIESEDGVFDWSIVDTPAQRWISRGGRVAFRFTTSESWLDYATPRWVEAAGAAMVRYRFGEGPDSDGPLRDPVYDDPIFLAKLERFLAMAGARYNGDPNVAFIDVGTFGTWGEGHTGGASRLDPQREQQCAKIHADLHRKYFPNTLLCISDDVIGHNTPGDDFPLMEYFRSQQITLRDDSILVQPSPNCWYHAGLAQHFWPHWPVILEHEHLGSSVERGAWDDELLIQSVEEYHAAYMSIHWWPDIEWERLRDTVRRINRRLGYRLQLRSIEWPKSVAVGEPFEVTMRWANAGVAPCYPGGFAALTLKDTAGGIVSLFTDESFDLRELGVAESAESAPITSRTARFRISPHGPVTPPGEYDVYVSVGRRDGTPVIALPHGNPGSDGSDGHRRYHVGRITIR